MSSDSEPASIQTSGSATLRVDPATGGPKGPVSLNVQELSRKLWHMSAGLLPFLCPLLPYYDRAAEHWGPNGVRLMILGTAAVLMGLSCWHSKKFARPDERNVAMAMVCYAVSVIALLVAFPAHLELGMTVLAVLSIGDGAAGLVGMTLKGPRLPWNPKKTVSGTIGFMLFAIPVAAGAYWFNAYPKVPWIPVFGLATTTCVVAALAESLPSRVNDNLRVGLAAAGVVVLHQWLVFGL